jgi:hypothetical protein
MNKKNDLLKAIYWQGYRENFRNSHYNAIARADEGTHGISIFVKTMSDSWVDSLKSMNNLKSHWNDEHENWPSINRRLDYG